MRRNPTLEEYKKLVDAAKKIENEKLWLSFEDVEIFGLKLPGIKDKVYCSIMGNHGDCFGVAIYRGKEGLESINAITSPGMSPIVREYLITDTGYYIAYFNSAEILSDRQEEMLNKLNYPTQNATAFLCAEPGCIPDDPKKEEVLFMTQVIEGLYEAVQYFYDLKQVFDFEQYIFIYDSEKKKHRKQTFKYTIKEYPVIVLNDEEIDDLKDLQRNGEEWGIDFIYTTFTEPRLDEREYRIKMMAVENRLMEEMIMAIPLDFEEETDSIVEGLIELIQENGIPNKIYFRNPHVFNTIAHLCFKLDIKIDMDDELEIIDDFISTMREELLEEEPHFMM